MSTKTKRNFLSQQVTSVPIPGKAIYATNSKGVLGSLVEADVTNMTPCFYEEADTRLLLHVADAVKKGFRKITIQKVDTDVAIINFDKIKPNELWLAFGTGANFKYIPIHHLVESIEPRFCSALLIFNSLTGCDTTFSLSGRGKKTAWVEFPRRD